MYKAIILLEIEELGDKELKITIGSKEPKRVLPVIIQDPKSEDDYINTFAYALKRFML